MPQQRLQRFDLFRERCESQCNLPVEKCFNAYSTFSNYRFRLTLSPNDKFLDFSKLKEFADDNIKFYANGEKFSKWVENTVGKGEIARYEQFLLFPRYFQKGVYCRHVKTSACLGKG